MANIESQHISLFLLILAIIFISAGVGTKSWGRCGGLFEGCLNKGAGKKDKTYDATLTMIVMTLFALAMLIVVLIIDIIGLIQGGGSGGGGMLRTVLLWLAFLCGAIALLVFTIIVTPIWSYLLVCTGIALSLVLAVKSVCS